MHMRRLWQLTNANTVIKDKDSVLKQSKRQPHLNKPFIFIREQLHKDFI